MTQRERDHARAAIFTGKKEIVVHDRLDRPCHSRAHGDPRRIFSQLSSRDTVHQAVSLIASFAVARRFTWRFS